MNILSAEALMMAIPEVGEATVEIPGLPGLVKVRGLSRAEIKGIGERLKAAGHVDKAGNVDNAALEQELFLAGLVEPKLGPEHWERLQGLRGGVIEKILVAINEQSSLPEADAKELRKSVSAGDGDAV